MLRIFGLVIRTNKEEKELLNLMMEHHESFSRVFKMALDATLDSMQKEEERHTLAMGAINLRDDIMRLDIREDDWYIVNSIMDLIDKNFGKENISEKDKMTTVDIDFGGNF